MPLNCRTFRYHSCIQRFRCVTLVEMNSRSSYSNSNFLLHWRTFIKDTQLPLASYNSYHFIKTWKQPPLVLPSEQQGTSDNSFEFKEQIFAFHAYISVREHLALFWSSFFRCKVMLGNSWNTLKYGYVLVNETTKCRDVVQLHGTPSILLRCVVVRVHESLNESLQTSFIRYFQRDSICTNRIVILCSKHDIPLICQSSDWSFDCYV